MSDITDDFMRQMLGTTREYTIVLLWMAAGRTAPGAEAIIWEHARRNFELRADGVLAVVCPVTDGGKLAGLYIFNAGPERCRELMEGDPGVRAGVFTYEVHTCRSFPGDALPG